MTWSRHIRWMQHLYLACCIAWRCWMMIRHAPPQIKRSHFHGSDACIRAIKQDTCPDAHENNKHSPCIACSLSFSHNSHRLGPIDLSANQGAMNWNGHNKQGKQNKIKSKSPCWLKVCSFVYIIIYIICIHSKMWRWWYMYKYTCTQPNKQSHPIIEQHMNPMQLCSILPVSSRAE